jgi:RimJ/RimL family protein N-acetyltransferase
MGRGVRHRGVACLDRQAFGELGARRVYATTMAVNLGSRRVMEKAGMRLVRLFYGEWPDRIPGDEHGDVEYAITCEDWAARTWLQYIGGPPRVTGEDSTTPTAAPRV